MIGKKTLAPTSVRSWTAIMGIFIRFSSLFSTARIPRVAVVARLTTTSTTSGSYGARAVSSMTKADLIKHSDAKVKRRKGLRKGRSK